MPDALPVQPPSGWWRVGKQIGATGAVISLLFWMFSELMAVVRENNAAQEVRHKDAMESNRALERHVATQIEVTRELSTVVRENTAETRAARVVSERLELALGWYVWPVPKKKDGLP